jgi:hypothetical protein
VTATPSVNLNVSQAHARGLGPSGRGYALKLKEKQLRVGLGLAWEVEKVLQVSEVDKMPQVGWRIVPPPSPSCGGAGVMGYGLD